MLLLPLLLALAGDPSPAPSTAAAPTPLTEIGRVQGRTVCASIVVHANAAIDGTLDNDRTFGVLLNRLTTTPLDRYDTMKRHRALDEIAATASQMRIQALNGEGEIRRLRALADASPSIERKTDLMAFANALGGALYRQRRVAADVQRMVVILEGRAAAAESERDLSNPNHGYSPGTPGFITTSGFFAERNGGETATLQAAAADLGERLHLILADEGIAADHAVGATTGC